MGIHAAAALLLADGYRCVPRVANWCGLESQWVGGMCNKAKTDFVVFCYTRVILTVASAKKLLLSRLNIFENTFSLVFFKCFI